MFVDRIYIIYNTYIYICNVGCSQLADCHLLCLKEKSTLRPRGVFRQIIGATRGGKTNHCHMVQVQIGTFLTHANHLLSRMVFYSILHTT